MTGEGDQQSRLLVESCNWGAHLSAWPPAESRADQPAATTGGEVMRRRGKALERYLNLPPAAGGPQPPDDDETARPSPFRKVPDDLRPPQHDAPEAS